MMCEAGATSLTSIPLRQEGRRREEHAAADREGVAPVDVPGAHDAVHGTELALARAAGQVLQRRVGSFALGSSPTGRFVYAERRSVRWVVSNCGWRASSPQNHHGEFDED